MMRALALGLPAYSKDRIVKSLYSVGLYGAEVGGMFIFHMKDVRISARKALGRGANLGVAGHDTQIIEKLNTFRMWQRRLEAGTIQRPLEKNIWSTVLAVGVALSAPAAIGGPLWMDAY
eukprot:5269884-Amphidinium_carterae.2